MAGKTVWTEEKLAYMVKHYHNTPNKDIAAATGISERTIQRKAKKLGIEKDADYLYQNSISGLREIDYQRLMGRKMGPPKGLRCNPKGEFKKGHKEDIVTHTFRVASIRARAESERIRLAHGLKPLTHWYDGKK